MFPKRFANAEKRLANPKKVHYLNMPLRSFCFWHSQSIQEILPPPPPPSGHRYNPTDSRSTNISKGENYHFIELDPYLSLGEFNQ